MVKRSKLVRRGVILLGIILIIGIYGYIQNNWIEVDRIAVPIEGLPKAFNGYTIVHVSDVHLDQQAASIDHLIRLVREQEPDLIVMTGDLVDRGTALETSGLDRLCRGLAHIAVTYAVTGNHEHDHDGRAEQWREIVTANGVKALDNQFDWVEREGERLFIAGLADSIPYSPELFRDAAGAEVPMLLLAHRPELFDSYASRDHDIRPSLVFSGHAHGGQVRIPFLDQGVIAPNQGLFPAYTAGMYEENDVRMFVSRGLGNSIIPMRIHNRPHLPVIELTGEAVVQ
ncbi:phosphoesterase [Xylanibacillus composti]|uniref:Phosphoesterase n=1 Tax=Xylanibacillus composti TaxID=1572762 RepID=A0A8J4H4P3_9BACL|nr:metallophosphoesterase [Xylanibacillus composti]GIQ69580.1 phosphoesterase [Xylanibacillus composti]